MIVSRDKYLQTLIKFQDKPVIKVLTGLRRSGKSSLLRMMMDRLKKARIPSSHILYINKESLEFDALQNYKDLNEWIVAKWKKIEGKKYLFVDEIQEIEGWEKTIASLLGDRTADIYISGSNAHLLASELATLLSGRYIEIFVLPLTFSEFLNFRKAHHATTSIEEDFALFLKYGGLPGIHEFELSDDVVFQYLHSLFNTVLYKDIVSRHKIRETNMLDRIARFAFDNCGNITSAKSIADYMKSQHLRVTQDTVIGYLEYLASAYLLQKVKRYDIKGKRHLETHEKYYLGDIGLRHGFIGYRDGDISGLLENVVFLELKHRGYSVSVGKLQNKEIDFIAEKDSDKLYIQVCYLLVDAHTEEREFSPLMQIKDNHPKLVLSMDTHWGEAREGIRREYLPDFLCHP